ncbi:MAG: epoxyqueuosine reductase QueH [bacterium]
MRVLLHTCCAPCAVMPVESLRGEGFEVTAYWFNPNIHPYGEWKLRKQALEQLSELADLPVIYDDDYDLTDSLQKLLANPIFGERCLNCYEDRLRAAAKTAVEKGFDAFTTTLLYSKYQLHDEICEIAGKIAEETGAEFLYRDFRILWGRGITASKKMGLYRQRYCGCILSELEAEKQREERRKAE